MTASIVITRVHVADLMRAAWPKDTAKHAAIASGQSHRTAQGWLSERFTPSAATLLRMADRNDKLRAQLILRLALQQGYQNAPMAQGALPVDGDALPDARRPADGPRASLADEG
jgi:hypothetical protein